MKIRRILLPTDLSPQVEPAKSFARQLARRHGAELLLLHSVLTHAHDFRQLGELLTEFLDKLATDAERSLELECTQLKKDGLVADTVVERKPSAYEAILERVESWQPDLVVMGTHGRTGMERWFLGSVAEKVVRHAPVPVVTVRPEAPPAGEIRTVLVPIDFSDHSRRAVAAAAETKDPEGSLWLLHVVLNPTVPGLYPGNPVTLFEIDPGLSDRIRARMGEWMEGRAFEAEVRESGDVAESILQAVAERKPDLVVIGTRGLTGLDYFLMGSVAEKVVRRSPVPVMSVK